MPDPPSISSLCGSCHCVVVGYIQYWLLCGTSYWPTLAATETVSEAACAETQLEWTIAVTSGSALFACVLNTADLVAWFNAGSYGLPSCLPGYEYNSLSGVWNQPLTQAENPDKALVLYNVGTNYWTTDYTQVISAIVTPPTPPRTPPMGAPPLPPRPPPRPPRCPQAPSSASLWAAWCCWCVSSRSSSSSHAKLDAGRSRTPPLRLQWG